MAVAFVMIDKAVGAVEKLSYFVCTAGQLQCPSFSLPDLPFPCLAGALDVT